MTNSIEIRPVRPNVGIRISYTKKLDEMIEEMNKSVLYWVMAWYKQNNPRIFGAMDASPIVDFLKKFKELFNYWMTKFKDNSNKISKDFSEKVQKDSDLSFRNGLKDKSIDVEFKTTRATQDVKSAIIAENVSLIRSIPSQYLDDVTQIVTDAFRIGRDAGYIRTQIMEKYGVTKRRATFIARDQTEKATASFNRLRQVELGIDKAEWVHSGAGKHPRPDHVRASGKIYNTVEGCLISGSYILPGQLPNCRCISKSIIDFNSDENS